MPYLTKRSLDDLRIDVARLLVFLGLGLFIHPSWSCTCDGTSSIGSTIATYPNLVEARVEDARTLEVTLQVTRVLKGKAPTGPMVVADSMCYATLNTHNMKAGHTYLLPISGPFVDPDPPRSGYVHSGPQEGQYTMAGCAESGFELINGTLYTLEQTTGAERRLRPYQGYSSFLRWRPSLETAYVMLTLVSASTLGLAKYLGLLLSLAWLAIGVTSIVLFARLGSERRLQVIALVVTLPVISLLIGVWGSIFRAPDLFNQPHNIEINWKPLAPLLGLAFVMCFAALWIRRHQVGRAFAVCYTAFIAPYAAAMTFVSFMAVNGRLP